jgi:V8-like Glu-specific endopeptidase
LLSGPTTGTKGNDGLLSGLAAGTGVRAAPGVAGGSARLLPPRREQAAGPAAGRAGAARAARPRQTTYGARWTTGGAVTRTTGRVFMTLNGTDFVCSASTVRSANRDVVVTAGHCVKDGAGQWAENWTFVPGYREGGQHPYGRYAARHMFVAAPWARSADDSYDVGMVALTTWSGRHVTDVAGFQDISFNPPRGGRAFGFGYPADPPYNGEHLIYCAGRLGADPHGETRSQGLGCDMTAGSSGGPWLSRFDLATGKGTLTSLSSFKYSDDQRTMYGPYFGEAVRALFTAAERA